jgi:hypothetical protein
MPSEPRFRYGLDPLGLAACALYAVNRWLVKPRVDSPFFDGRFNDLLLIPCALPLVLWLQRRLGLRTHDGPPTVGEITGHLIIWSLIAEVLGPHWLQQGTGDVGDCAAYAAGALAAWCFWRGWQSVLSPGRTKVFPPRHDLPENHTW